MDNGFIPDDYSAGGNDYYNTLELKKKIAELRGLSNKAEKKIAELNYKNRHLENELFKLGGGRVICENCGYQKAVMDRRTVYGGDK